MNENINLELFYILPYTKNIDGGYYHYNDDKGYDTYIPVSESIYRGFPVIFDEKEQLLDWFIKNANKPIPIVYRIKFISNYQGVDDVIKIIDLTNDETKYYTALSENAYAVYNESMGTSEGKFIWNYIYIPPYTDQIFNFKYIYEEFCKRGIKLKFNVYDQDVDKTKSFDYVGNYWEAKGKKLILHKYSEPNYFDIDPFVPNTRGKVRSKKRVKG